MLDGTLVNLGAGSDVFVMQGGRVSKKAEIIGGKDATTSASWGRALAASSS